MFFKAASLQLFSPVCTPSKREACVRPLAASVPPQVPFAMQRLLTAKLPHFGENERVFLHPSPPLSILGAALVSSCICGLIPAFCANAAGCLCTSPTGFPFQRFILLIMLAPIRLLFITVIVISYAVVSRLILGDVAGKQPGQVCGLRQWLHRQCGKASTRALLFAAGFIFVEERGIRDVCGSLHLMCGD